MGGGQVHALAHHGGGHGNAVLGTQGQHALEGVPPGMHGQAEGAVVNGQQPASAQVAVGLHGLGRVHVHIGPVRVVGAGFHQREVEGTEAPADFRKAIEIAAVAAEEDRKSTRLNSSHSQISYAVFCLKKKKKKNDSYSILLNEPRVRVVDSTVDGAAQLAIADTTVDVDANANTCFYRHCVGLAPIMYD